MFSRNLRVSIFEDNIIWADKAANLEQLKRNLRNMPEDTDLVILPELFTTGFIIDDRDLAASLAERNTGETMSTLHQLANEYRVAFTGTFL
ncbi:MAG: nitrilase family protein, partial [Muribaculaceae bacterium]|nr:nitrilase family protein [Muribaculaceae bacterium]